jgi:PncC family amidohydrolase
MHDDANDLGLGALLRQLGWTIGTAESCTGGLIVQQLIAVPGSSDYVRGGIVTYANDVKVSLLGLDRADLERAGVVSEATAVAMATAARRVLGVDVGLATTGIAGPADPRRRSQKPVGLVYVAVAWPAGTTCRQHQWPPQSRSANMTASAEAALRLGHDICQAALAAR